jgi:hypothetical protein
VSGFLQREDRYALPPRQRHLTALILRKLLASSSQAIAATLDKLRLETLHDEKVQDDAEFTEALIEAEELEDDLLDEILAEPDEAEAATPPRSIDRKTLREEIDILQRLADWARRTGTDTKTTTLLTALDIGFAQMATTGAALLAPADLPADWDPATDPRLTAWEIVHHLIRVLASGGEGAAGELGAKLGAKAEIARLAREPARAPASQRGLFETEE